MAKLRVGKDSRTLLNVVGRLDHSGEDVLSPDSTRYRLLEKFVRRAEGKAPSQIASTTNCGSSTAW